jgi:hypothetical protein
MMKKMTLALTMAAVCAIGLGGLVVAQQGGEESQGARSPDMGAQLIEGLRKTPGCLGVDAGRFMSGKNAIIAWFEDKAAAVRWYHSETHQQMMRMAFGEEAANIGHAPLEHVKDGIPVMVIASITFVNEPQLDGINLPISQIAIELYTPLPGGAHVNGRLAPATFKVEHMRDYTPPAAE